MKYSKIGYHISVSNPKEAIERLRKDKVGYCQIFVSNNRSLQMSTWTEKRIKEFREATKDLKVVPFIHGPYLINLSNPEHKNKNICKNVILDQLRIANEINSPGVVIHMGKSVKISPEEAFDNYSKAVKDILSKYDGSSRLILETAAGQGTEICTDLKDLYRLFETFTEEEKDKLGICIDTCHIFSAGYDISKKEKVIEFFDDMMRDFGEYISLIHLNDSKVSLGSRKDRHQDIGFGYIGLEGLKTFYSLSSKENIPIVLETIEENSSYIEQIKSLM